MQREHFRQCVFQCRSPRDKGFAPSCLSAPIIMCQSSTSAAKAITRTRTEPALPDRRQPVSASAPEAADAPAARTRKKPPHPVLPSRSPRWLHPSTYVIRSHQRCLRKCDELKFVATRLCPRNTTNNKLVVGVARFDHTPLKRAAMATFPHGFPLSRNKKNKTATERGGRWTLPRGFNPGQGRDQGNGSMGRNRNSLDRRVGRGLQSIAKREQRKSIYFFCEGGKEIPTVDYCYRRFDRQPAVTRWLCHEINRSRLNGR